MAFTGHLIICGGGGGVESQREELDQLIWGCWRIEVLIDCWSKPGFWDFKEKWTVLAFYPRSFSSHMICTSARARSCTVRTAVSAEESVERQRELQSAWEVIGWDSFNQELVWVAVLGLHKSWHIAGTWHLCGFRFIWVQVGGGSNHESKGSSSADVHTQFPALPGRRWPALLGRAEGMDRTILLSSQINSWHVDNV